MSALGAHVPYLFLDKSDSRRILHELTAVIKEIQISRSLTPGTPDLGHEAFSPGASGQRI